MNSEKAAEELSEAYVPPTGLAGLFQELADVGITTDDIRRQLDTLEEYRESMDGETTTERKHEN